MELRGFKSRELLFFYNAHNYVLLLSLVNAVEGRIFHGRGTTEGVRREEQKVTGAVSRETP